MRQLRIVIFALVSILIVAQIFTAPTHLYYFYAAVAVIFVGNAILALPAIRAFTGRASKPGGGGVVGAVRGSIGGGDAADELAEGLRAMGVQAEVVEPDSPEAVDHDLYAGGVFGNPPLKVIKLGGRNIDLVEIYRVPTQNTHMYAQNYVVKVDARHLAQDLKANLMPVYQGAFNKSLTDYRWVDRGAGTFTGWKVNLPMFVFGLIFAAIPLFALIQIAFPGDMYVNYDMLPYALIMILAFIAVGFMMSFGQLLLIRYRRPGSDSTLARALNGDAELKRMIMHAFGEARISVAAGPAYGYVAIAGGEVRRRTGFALRAGGGSVLDPGGLTLGLRDFPDRNAFEVYDRIAGHIRGIAPEAHAVAVGGEYARPVQPSPAPLQMRTSLKNLGLLGRISGGLFIIGFALAWFAAAYYFSGSNWQSLLPALPVVGIFLAIGAITCVYGYRKWAGEKRRRQAGPVSNR